MTIEMKVSATGDRLVTMTEAEYEDLIDARDAAIAMRGIADGTVETVPDGAVDDYLAAPTPLAFWRKYRKLTQVELAGAADISQPYLAQLENGQREAAVAVLQRLAKRLGVRMDDLLPV
jgi:DNA-binding XRE family transcriptional regulator